MRSASQAQLSMRCPAGYETASSKWQNIADVLFRRLMSFAHLMVSSLTLKGLIAALKGESPVSR